MSAPRRWTSPQFAHPPKWRWKTSRFAPLPGTANTTRSALPAKSVGRKNTRRTTCQASGRRGAIEPLASGLGAFRGPVCALRAVMNES